MKKIKFLLFFGLLAVSAKSQINNKILETFLNDNVFEKVVVPGFYKECDTIHVIDTIQNFLIEPRIKFSKKVLIEKDYHENPHLKKWYCNNLIVTIKAEKKNFFRLIYFHEPSNSSGYVLYKYINGKLKKIKYQYGQY